MSMKRVFSAILIASLLAVQCGTAVSAEETGADAAFSESVDVVEVEKTAEELAAEEKNTQYETTADTNSLAGWPQGPNVCAASAIVMDMDSRAILYAKKADEAHYPASITKLLTTLVALENGDLSDTITFSEDSINILSWDDAHIGMKPGEQISLNDALYAVLLASANEVSYAVAENVGTKMGGGYETFIQEMNDRAVELGCTGSHWVNPNGLHDDQHYTTAHDMAVIASAVYQREEFRTIMKSLEYRIPPTNLTDVERVFQQNHKMLWEGNDYYYEYCTGGKTGYTDQSGTTLVTMADNGTLRLAAVVLVDYGVDAYTDTRAMMDYVFNNFSKVSLKEQKTSEYIESFEDKDAHVVLPAGITFSQVECELISDKDGISEKKSGAKERQGTAVYTYQGQEVGRAEVILAKEFFKSKETGTTDSEKQDTAEKKKSPFWIWFLAIGATVFGIAVLFYCYLQYLRRERARRRRRRQRRRRKCKK